MERYSKCMNCGLSKRYADEKSSKGKVYCTQNQRGVSINGLCDNWLPPFGQRKMTPCVELSATEMQMELGIVTAPHRVKTSME